MGLNSIAGELENPFGTDSNDLPMVHFQGEMNSCLLMLLHPSVDHIPGLSERCEFDFGSLFNYSTISKRDKRLSHFPRDDPGNELSVGSTYSRHISDIGLVVGKASTVARQL